MKSKKWAYGKPPLFWMLVIEITFEVIVSAALSLHSITIGYSALLGGLIATSSSMAFDFFAYRFERANAVHKMLRHAYVAEIAKMSVAAVLFAVIFKNIVNINIAALLVMFVIVLISHGFVAMYCAQKFAK